MNIFWLLIALVLAFAAWKAPLGVFLRVLLAAAAIAAALVGFDLIHLPTIEEIVEEIGGRLGKWTYVLVGVMAFLETGAFLGFLAPGETMVLFGGVLAGEGTIDLIPLIIVVWVSAMLGDVTSYAIGRRYGRDFLLRHGERFKIGEPQIQVVERFFERHGDLTVLLGRWVGVVRPLVPFMAGSTRVPFARFLMVDLVATALWTIALCVLGSVFWRNFDQLTSVVGRTLLIVGTMIVVTSVLIVGISLRRSRARSAMVEAWLEEQRAEGSTFARPAAGAWATFGRLDGVLRGGRREPTDGTGTLDDAPEPQPPPDPDR